MTVLGPGSLHSLPPVGVGTPRVESLSSYLVRLAVAHVVPTNLLALRILSEVVPRDNHGHVVARCRGSRMNGAVAATKALVSLLCSLTLREDLHLLTMLPWQYVIGGYALVSRRRRWCPVCYEDMRESHGRCWDPLVWHLAALTCCPIHSLCLSESCPDCGRPQRWLPYDTDLGFCMHCGADLGASALPSSLCSEIPVASQRDVWLALGTAELFAAFGSGVCIVSSEELIRRLRALVQSRYEGNVSQFARVSGVSVYSPREWFDRGGLVRFDCLLSVCWGSRVRPSELLLVDPPSSTATASLPDPASFT